MVLSKWREFPSAPCLAGKKKLDGSHLYVVEIARPWHASELVSFLVGLRTYQHPGTFTISRSFRLRMRFFLWRCGPTRAMASSPLRFLDHTQRCTTIGRIPLDEWPARRRDLYLTTHNTHKTFMPPAGFELAISASELSQTHALDRAATGIG